MHSTWSKATVLIALTALSIAAYGASNRTLTTAGVQQPAERRVVARLVTAKTPLVPGEIAEIGIHLTIQPGWHIYWDGQNDTGLPVMYEARFPEGFEPQPILWPAPMRHVGKGDILDHIYEDQVTLIVPVRVPRSAAAGTEITLEMDLSWLVCKNVCLPEESSVKVRLPVGATGADQARTAESMLIDRTRALLPRPMPKDRSVAAADWQGSTLILTGHPGQRIEFYPGPASARVADLVRTGASTTGRLELRFEGPAPARAQGVLAVWPDADGPAQYYQVELNPPAAPGAGRNKQE
ncbi:MAG: hypothetical protein IT436_17985 [Phycisphaerales bacterium]|nr:hypothetical protein [Phycisphaerales bacterium]